MILNQCSSSQHEFYLRTRNGQETCEADLNFRWGNHSSRRYLFLSSFFILTKFYSFSVKKRSLPAQQQKGSKKLRQRLSTSSSSCTSTCSCRELAFGSVHKVLKRDRITGNYTLIRENSEIQQINEEFFYSYIFQTRRPENMMLEVYQAMREKIAALWDGYLYEGIVPWNIFKNFNVIFQYYL